MNCLSNWTKNYDQGSSFRCFKPFIVSDLQFPLCSLWDRCPAPLNFNLKQLMRVPQDVFPDWLYIYPVTSQVVRSSSSNLFSSHIYDLSIIRRSYRLTPTQVTSIIYPYIISYHIPLTSSVINMDHMRKPHHLKQNKPVKRTF